MHKIIPYTFLFFLIPAIKIQAQYLTFSPIKQIDSNLSVTTSKFKDYELLHPKHFALDGGYNDFSRYKRILGIKIRIAQGTSQTEDATYNKELFYFSDNYVIARHSYVINEFDTLFFINNQPVKFIKIVSKHFPKTDKDAIVHKKIYHFNEGLLISSMEDGNENTLRGRKLKILLIYIHSVQKSMMTNLNKKW